MSRGEAPRCEVDLAARALRGVAEPWADPPDPEWSEKAECVRLSEPLLAQHTMGEGQGRPGKARKILEFRIKTR